jgi:hypothetical protein
MVEIDLLQRRLFYQTALRRFKSAARAASCPPKVCPKTRMHAHAFPWFATARGDHNPIFGRELLRIFYCSRCNG